MVDILTFVTVGVFWVVGGNFLIFFVMGWSLLPREYRRPRDLGPELRVFRYASCYLGRPRILTSQYRHRMRVEVGERGLTLQPALAFGCLFPKVFLRFDDLIYVEKTRDPYGDFRFRTIDGGQTVILYGECGDYCAERWRLDFFSKVHAPS